MAEKPRKSNLLLLTYYFLLITSYFRAAVLVVCPRLFRWVCCENTRAFSPSACPHPAFLWDKPLGELPKSAMTNCQKLP